MIKCKECGQEIIFSKGFEVSDDMITELKTIFYCENECMLDFDDIKEQIDDITLFTITYPNPPTWNGKTSLNDNTELYPVKLDKETKEKVLKEGSLYKRWDDGWVAQINVEEFDNLEEKSEAIQKYKDKRSLILDEVLEKLRE